jgi:RNA polymerase sigma-70 factor (ECF subfamily)
MAGRIAAGDHQAFESVMRTHNQQMFRVARAILRDDAEAEDAVQDAYLEAFRKIDTFRGDARLATWLTRVVINQALMRLRRQKRERVVVPFEHRAKGDDMRDAAADAVDTRAESPRDAVMRSEVRRMIERRLDDLPVAFRAVFVMREVEDMSVEETAACLCIPATTVRTRLFRARALLREALARDMDSATMDVFGFAGERCDRIVAAVLARVAASPH